MQYKQIAQLPNQINLTKQYRLPNKHLITILPS